MKRSDATRKAIFLTTIAVAIAASLFMGSCRRLGVFATIAVSDEISEGLLPDGTTASKVLHIDNGNLDDYDFFSSGPRLWVRNTTDRTEVTFGTRWVSVELTDDSDVTWTAINSMAIASNRIVLTMNRETEDVDLEVGLFYFDDYDSGTNSVNLTRVPGTDWFTEDNYTDYEIVKVFSPDNSNNLFVNVQNFSGEFADSDTTFEGSDMYRYDISGVTPADWSTAADAGWSELDTRYVTSAAHDGSSTYVFTAADGLELTSGDGVILDGSGTVQTDVQVDVPVTGATWMANVGSTGTFIVGGMSTTSADGYYTDSEGDDLEIYPVYVSTDGSSWTPIDVDSSAQGYRYQCFLDVSNTEAGGLAGSRTDRILAGSRSTYTDEATGYAEILFTDGDDFTTWEVMNESLDFAYSSNYLVSDLRTTSIEGLTLLTDGVTGDSYVYAASRLHGIWSINADDPTTSDDNSPSWETE